MSDKKSTSGQSSYPLLPLREVIIFPHMVVPLFVGREKSIEALDRASKANNELFLVTQKDSSILNPSKKDVYKIGIIASIIQMLRLPDNTVKVLVEGRTRARIDEFIEGDEGYFAKVTPLEETFSNELNIEAIMRSVKTVFEQYVKMNKKIPPEILMSVSTIREPGRLGDIILSNLTMKIEDKQVLLEESNIEKRLELLLEKMQGEIEIINVEKRIRSRVKVQMEKSQKEYYLNEQMNAIQKELGQREDGKSDILEMEETLKNKSMPKEVKEKVQREIRKLKMMSPMSAEATVVRNYIDWMLTLPWSDYSKDSEDLVDAKKVLDRDHYALNEVKERFTEYLAVKSLLKTNKASKGVILCLAGPPGVGKTSMARSLAQALNRTFVRISLGGVRDEAEIRGHRRTYVGAMPGKIIQALKRVKKGNPVILLDEVDKMTRDFRGDPSSALLEVLDPEQNKNFTDHYLEVEYDLSQIIFIMTANDIGNISHPLRDRMEIIRISGYTTIEKIQIAKRYLLNRALENNGLEKDSVHIGDTTMDSIILNYTKEAGVRELERLLNKVCRKYATDVVFKKENSPTKSTLSKKKIGKYLGTPHFNFASIEDEPRVGLVNGLAWTPVGGEVLHIEVIMVEGSGKIQITGKLGEVMQESAKAALSYVRSLSNSLEAVENWYSKYDIHVHVPEGATPKDGPSAGITLATALVSVITGIPVKQNIAMTGEITLRGIILPIGGLREKVLAAHQLGIKEVIIPSRNKKDIDEVPARIRDKVKIYPCDTLKEALRLSLDLKKPDEFLNNQVLTVIKDKGSTLNEVAN